MGRVESEEPSNDDATIISELLNSAEAMHNSTVPTTIASSIKIPLQQKHEQQIVPNVVAATFCDTANQHIMVSLQENHSIIDGGLLNSTQYSDMEDLNKMRTRHVHIPYILNGELYQIQTQDGENVTVKCCHCPPDRVYRGSVRSTGNFHMHIKRRHPDLLEKLHNMKVNALLERRDRLMRSRKATHRNNRNRVTNAFDNSNEHTPELSTTTVPGSQITLDTTTESSLLHTHKLKIKTVFQRHQLQQREAAEMRKWKNTEYVVMPIVKLSPNEESEQPINYSLKSQENYNTLALFSSTFTNANQQEQQEKRKPHDITTSTSLDNVKNLSNHQTNLTTNYATEQSKLICENHANNRNLSISSVSMSSPSAMSSYSSGHQYDMGTNKSFNSFSPQHHNLSIIKPEHLIMAAETRAIDLTMHADSGIFSTSQDKDFENDSRSNTTGAGTHESNTATMIDRTGNIESENNNSANIARWQHLLMQVENSLRDIQREMNVRNQIESNRMFLDIAKFKFLNPSFQFNW